MTQATPTPQTQPKNRRALSHLSHGLTGQRIYIFSDAEQQAYDELCRGFEESFDPKTEAERQLVRAISDDNFRLRRAANFESAIFAESADKFAADPDQSTGDPLLDSCISNGETWLRESKNLNLLSLYENRIHRRVEKNMAELRRLQAERRVALEAAVAEAAILAQAAEATGEKADTADPFLRRNFEFSAFEMARMIDRHRRLEEAKKYVAGLKKAQRRAA
jgi:hypothetical protein